MFRKISAFIIVMLLIELVFLGSINAKIVSKNEIFDITQSQRKNIQGDKIWDFVNGSIYFSSQQIFGNKNMSFCGPAYINSTGKGLHLAKFKRILRIETPVSTRSLGNIWLIFCDYWDKNATTTITPLLGGESISLDGNHSIVVGIFWGHSLRRLEKLFGRFGIDVHINGNSFYEKMTEFLFWMFMPIKSSFKGFKEPLNFYGYTPFVIWSNSSILR